MANSFAQAHQNLPEAVGFKIPVERTWNITIAQNVVDETYCLLRFPTGARIDIDSLEFEPSDIDTNGTPLVGLDVGIGDSDGLIDDALIAASIAGRTGVKDWADDQYGAAVSRMLDVGDRWLILKIQAASATAVAGTIRIYLEYVRSIVSQTVALAAA